MDVLTAKYDCSVSSLYTKNAADTKLGAERWGFPLTNQTGGAVRFDLADLASRTRWPVRFRFRGRSKTKNESPVGQTNLMRVRCYGGDGDLDPSGVADGAATQGNFFAGYEWATIVMPAAGRQFIAALTANGAVNTIRQSILGAGTYCALCFPLVVAAEGLEQHYVDSLETVAGQDPTLEVGYEDAHGATGAGMATAGCHGTGECGVKYGG